MGAVTDLERRPGSEPERWEEPAGFLDRRPIARPQVDLYKSRGLDLTPQEVAARRSNRRWMLGLAGGATVVFVCVTISIRAYSNNEPTGPKITAPPGYQVVNDSYFAFVVPSSWAQNPTFTDAAGDVDYSGPSGWAGQNYRYYTAVPTLYERSQPTSLQAFGQDQPAPYTLSQGHSIDVKGASGAFEYAVTRPDGFRGVAVDTWSAPTGVEMWLMIDAPPAVTDEILSSLTAGESK